MTILQGLFWTLFALGLGVIIRKIFMGDPNRDIEDSSNIAAILAKGKSAYQMAKELDPNIGSEEDWVKSIRIADPWQMPGCRELIAAGYDKPVKDDGNFDWAKYDKMRLEYLTRKNLPNRADLKISMIPQHGVDWTKAEIHPDLAPGKKHTGYDVDLQIKPKPDAAQVKRERLKSIQHCLKLDSSLRFSEEVYELGVATLSADDGPAQASVIDVMIEYNAEYQDYLHNLYRRLD